jgi:presenilin-like A22 family membrane protease
MNTYRPIVRSLIGIVVGSIIYFGAEWWAKRSEETGAVVGANIGAGIVGLLGIAIGIVSVIFLIVAIIRRW